MKEEIINFLQDSGISPTPVRIMVFKSLKESKFPLSLADLEISLESVDKSTISRTLTMFREHHIVHSFNDGSGSVKYEICNSFNEEVHDDLHVHFRCEKCGLTTCLTSIKIPEVNLPAGYEAKESNYIISGICSNCNHIK